MYKVCVKPQNYLEQTLLISNLEKTAIVYVLAILNKFLPCIITGRMLKALDTLRIKTKNLKIFIRIHTYTLIFNSYATITRAFKERKEYILHIPQT